MFSLSEDVWLSKLRDEITLPGLPHFSRSTIAGISVAIAGNVLISLALNCQKLAHRRLERERELQQTHTNGERSGRRSNGTKRNEQDDILELTEEGEENEPTLPGISLRQAPQSSEQGLATENQPLLPRTHSDGTTTRKTPFSRRMFPWSKQKSTSSPLHSLVPVDIVIIEPSGAAGRRSSRKKEDKEVNNGHESDYLKSKLWYTFFLCQKNESHA
jgi:magnesium transporter